MNEELIKKINSIVMEMGSNFLWSVYDHSNDIYISDGMDHYINVLSVRDINLELLLEDE